MEADQVSHQRRRSASYDSVSTISTRNSRSPGLSDSRKHRGSKSPSPTRPQPRRPSYSSDSHHNPRDSLTSGGYPDEVSPRRPLGQDIRSREHGLDHPDRFREHSSSNAPAEHERPSRQVRRYSASLSRSPSPVGRQQPYRSRSPNRQRFENSTRQPQRQRSRDATRENLAPRKEQRERSLSPFSKRIALTRGMNSDH